MVLEFFDTAIVVYVARASPLVVVGVAQHCDIVCSFWCVMAHVIASCENCSSIGACSSIIYGKN